MERVTLFFEWWHETACSDWKTEIENEFPKLFSKSVEGWIWASKEAQQNKTYLFKANENYGFDWNGIYCTNLHTIDNDGIPATDKEVEKALIKEAKKRGFKDGVVIKNDVINTEFVNQYGSGDIRMANGTDSLTNDIHFIYNKGEWAEIIQTITKEEAEKQLNKTIVG